MNFLYVPLFLLLFDIFRNIFLLSIITIEEPFIFSAENEIHL